MKWLITQHPWGTPRVLEDCLAQRDVLLCIGKILPCTVMPNKYIVLYCYTSFHWEKKLELIKTNSSDV